MVVTEIRIKIDIAKCALERNEPLDPKHRIPLEMEI